MKILLVTPLYPPEIGGPATYAKLLNQELPKYGHAIEILPFSLVKRLPSGFRHFMLFLKILRKGRASDIIFAQDVFSVGLPAMVAAKVLGKPFIVRVPGDFAWEQARVQYRITDTIEMFQEKKYPLKIELYRAIERWIVRSAVLVMTPSDYFSAIIRKWGPRVNPVTVYNGIDTKAMEAFRSQRRGEGFSVCSAGRMVPWKGFDVLIDIVAKHPHWTLTLIGDGPEKVRLIEKTKTLRISERVHFTGTMDQKKLWQTIADHNVFVLNSSFESFSYQVVESMALGVPVIATTGCNLEEIITNNENGILVLPNNASALEEGMVRLENDAMLAQSIAHAANRRASQFSIKQTIEKLLSLVCPLNKKKILFLGTDRGVFVKGSAVQERLLSYGVLAERVIYIIATKGKKYQRIDIGNVSFIPTQSLFSFMHPIGFLVQILRNARRGDIISPQDPGYLGLIAWFSSRIIRMKLYVQLHTDILSPYYRIDRKHTIEQYIARFIVRRADKIRVVSTKIEQSVSPISPVPISVIPIYTPLRAVTHKTSDVFTFLVLARLEKEKNITSVIEAFATVCKSYPATELHIAGTGQQQTMLQEKVRSLGISDRVCFLGWVDNTVELLALADAFIQNSWFEGYGLALVEALAAGVPTVSTEVGVAPDLIRDSENSYLCPVGNTTILTEKMLALRAGDALKFRAVLLTDPIKVQFPNHESYIKALQTFYE